MKEQTDSKLDMKRWAAYSAAGMAALTASADTAEAEITHIVVGATWTSGDDFYYALENGASLNMFHPGGRARAGVYNATNGTLGSIAGFAQNGFNYASNLGSGVNISTQAFLGGFLDLASGSGYAGSQFSDTSGFLVFTFDTGGGSQFGWMRLTAAGDAPVNTYTIEEYAWGDVDEAVSVGQTVSVPEPSSLGLLALGAVGVLATRRKKLAVAS
jgi:hypothetical protein